MRKLIVGWLFFLIMTPWMLCGRELYVRAGDAGNGSRETPFGTLWEAFDAAAPGDVIHVTRGAYHGLLGAGNFTLSVPNVTVLGGYNQDFTVRDPFRLQTVLERAADYAGKDENEPILIIKDTEDRNGNVLIDGLVFDGRSRNVYDQKGRIVLRRGWMKPLVDVRMKDTTIRNCIIINHSWTGVSGHWSGAKNEISNCFFINLHYTAFMVETSTPETVILLRHNSFVFLWRRYSTGNAILIKQWARGVLEKNLFAYIQGTAVDNKNPGTSLRHNLFFNCRTGYYRGHSPEMDMTITREEDLALLSRYPGRFLLKDAADNRVEPAVLTPDPAYFRQFSEVFTIEPDQLDPEKLEELRRSMGYSINDVEESNDFTGLAYRADAVVPSLVITGDAGARPLP